MITNFFIPELNNHDVQELWFQQDGATCHTARATIDLLKDMLGDCLISRFGPVNWPPRSCDLTPLDYFLWGYVKSLVYADKPQTLDHLEDNNRRVIADIRPQMLEKVIENWTSRLDYIQASRGSPTKRKHLQQHRNLVKRKQQKNNQRIESRRFDERETILCRKKNRQEEFSVMCHETMPDKKGGKETQRRNEEGDILLGPITFSFGSYDIFGHKQADNLAKEAQNSPKLSNGLTLTDTDAIARRRLILIQLRSTFFQNLMEDSLPDRQTGKVYRGYRDGSESHRQAGPQMSYLRATVPRSRENEQKQQHINVTENIILKILLQQRCSKL
ncbi:uncharacterized protein TNCV_675221 [Trichonephila clavipes]|nr:uncharacterized protein TNCV_675221 [Trichonephila clavipes]